MVLICVVLATLVLAGNAQAAAPTGNLVRNPGGDAAQAGETNATTQPIPSWTTTGAFATTPYGCGQDCPPADAPAAGANSFAGANAATSTAVQTVAAAGAAAEIDADSVSVTLKGPVVASPPAFGPGGLISAPSNKKCVSRRNFTIHLKKPRKPLTIEQGLVFVNGKRVAIRKGRRVTAPVDLRGLPKGRYLVKITVILSNGDIVSGTRRYRTCEPRRL